jgi:uncharacterized protein GlcG (DUF336 family)
MTRDPSGTLLSAALLAMALPAGAASEPPSVSLKSLAVATANRVAVAAVAECGRRGYKVAAAVVGRDGNLLAFLRHPLAGPHTIAVSQQKAYSAASLQAPTSAMSSRPDLRFAPGILLIVGGVPIDVGGNFYGGVGVAGADPDVDERCAEAGVEAVKEALEFAQ